MWGEGTSRTNEVEKIVELMLKVSTQKQEREKKINDDVMLLNTCPSTPNADLVIVDSGATEHLCPWLECFVEGTLRHHEVEVQMGTTETTSATTKFVGGVLLYSFSHCLLYTSDAADD